MGSKTEGGLLSTKNKIKTEHSGAKNGGGYWGKRTDAKKISKKLRRNLGKKLIQELINFKYSLS